MRIKKKNGIREIYKFYLNRFTKQEIQSGLVVDYKTFSEIIREFNLELSRILIDEGTEFKLPARLGFFRIKKYKKKIKLNEDGSIDKSKMSVDWKATKELWKREYPGIDKDSLKQIKGKPLVYHLNEHTDGYKFFLYWNKKGSNAVNRSVYSFIFTNVNHRWLAHTLKTNHEVQYYE